MRLCFHFALSTGVVLGAVACDRAPDPAFGCPIGAAAPVTQPIDAYRIYVDGSRSMAPFLAPNATANVVTAYEELLFRLFTQIDSQDSAESWLFGDTLVQLTNTAAARQQLVTRSTYQRGQSRLELAFRHSRAFLDSLATMPADSASPQASSGTGVAIIVTDGLQSGSGRQLHILAEFDRMIRDHVATGGSFAFITRMAGQYPANRTGVVRPSETKPVLAILFGSGAARNELERLARELSSGPSGGDGQFFILPVRGATTVRLHPREGVRQVLSAEGEPPIFTFQTESKAVELLADAELDATTFANLPVLEVNIERCAGQTWEPAGAPSGWSTDSVRVDSSANRVHLTLRRTEAAAERSGLFRVRLEGNPVPPWIAGFGTGDEGTESDISRFFGGLQALAGTDAASFGTFYLRVRSD